MKRFGLLPALLAALTLACATLTNLNPKTRVPQITTEASPPQTAQSPPQAVQAFSTFPNSALVDSYDPDRDPAEDLKQAILIAQDENKRIMLELGGDWCIWCRYMDEFYATHRNILQFRADHYLLVKVNVSDENMNEDFLSQFPPAAGYPHIYILDSDGTFLHSQDTAKLEDGKDSYVPEVFLTFLQKWALPD